MVRAYSWQDTMGGLAGGVCADRKGKGRDTQSASDFDSRNEQVPTHKYSGYFLDPDTETDFIRSHQGKKRVWLLCATLVFVLISIVDLAAGTGNGWVGGDEGIDLAQRVGTFLSYLILGSVALWYPFSPASFEKVVAAGILLWVFSVTLLSDDIVRPTSADEGYMILAILIALNIMFVGLFLIALPLRRPVLIFVIGGVCAILAVACVIISVVNRSNPEIVLDASSGIMAVAIVLVAIGFGLAREEHACRVMLFRARYQKMKIAHLMEERDELIRVKKTGQQAGFSSAERLVELVAGAIEDLRWQENVLRHHAWGGDCTTSKRMAETTRRTIKELTETAALASHAESLMQVDVQQMIRYANPFGLPDLDSGIGAIRSGSGSFLSPTNAQQQAPLSPAAMEALSPMSAADGEVLPGEFYARQNSGRTERRETSKVFSLLPRQRGSPPPR